MGQEEEERVDDEYEGEEKPYYQLDDGKFEVTYEHITESKGIRMLFQYGWAGELPGAIEGVRGPIVRKAFDFCKARGEVKKQHWKDGEIILQQKLKLFDDKFFQENHSDAIDLSDVACRLKIRSLFYLMKERAAEMLAEKTPDDIRKHFRVRYVADEITDREVRRMKRVVSIAPWAFRSCSSRTSLNPVVSDA
uniref:SKP1-like protein 12 n=1 Tax=Erigeron canadensis TaxID=72917 RepID=UPI001CB9245B|nr:SKP1-like protein 12 [Erigeron canadensis]